MFWIYLMEMITIVTPLITGVYWLTKSNYVKMAICFCSAIALIASYLFIELKIISDDIREKK